MHFGCLPASDWQENHRQQAGSHKSFTRHFPRHREATPPPTSSRGRRPWRSMTLCLHGLPRFARNDSQRREMLCILELACKRLARKPSPAGWLPLAPQLARKKTRPASEHRSRSAGCRPCRSRCSPNYWRGRACSPSGRHPQHRGAAQSLIFASKDLLLTSPKTSDSAATTRRAS